MERIHVETGVPYDVIVGDGASSEAVGFIRATFPQATKIALVADANVDRLHGDRVGRMLEETGRQVERIVFPAGEKSKTLDTYAELVRGLAALRLSRRDIVVALGGGVTGDLSGFAAATYMRGIDFIQIPTSLLAMVDSSVGGKTGVDLPDGKNLVGAFHQPRAVLCDPAFLATLPADWRRDGMGEVLKYAVLGDADLFAALEAAPAAPLAERDIARCIRMKRDIVSRDEFESGERKLLNLGHSFGHAIEKLSAYTVSHGCAVATGVAVAARVSARLGLLAEPARARIESLVTAMGHRATSPFSAEAVAQIMASDKKVSGGGIDLVLPTDIGVCVLRPTPLDEIKGLLD